MKEHSDTIVPHSFVNKNSGSNLEQKNGVSFQDFFFWLRAEVSELNIHMSKSYVSSIRVA